MAAEIYQNAYAPESLVLIVTNGSSGVDMTTVSAVSMSVQKPDGSTTTWTASISGATTSQLTATHNMPASPGPSDVTLVGEYSVVVVCTLPSGIIRSTPLLLVVRPYYGDPL